MADVSVVFGANTRELDVALGRVRQSVQAFAFTVRERAQSVVASMAHISVAVQGVAAVAQKFSAAWSAAALFEDAATRLAPLVGGLEQSEALARSLREQAANGTASFEELVSVAGKLASVFKDPGQIKAWTRRFHDLAAGTGESAATLVERFVRGAASGVLNSGFLDIFAARGVNLYAPLARELNMAEAEVRKLAAAGGVSFAAVEKQLISLTSAGGKFAGTAEKMSSTAAGTAGTLRANMAILSAEFAKPVNVAIVPVLSHSIELCRAFAPAVASCGRALAAIVNPTTAAVAACGALTAAVAALTAAIVAGASAIGAFALAHPVILAVSVAFAAAAGVVMSYASKSALAAQRTRETAAAVRELDAAIRAVPRAFDGVSDSAALSVASASLRDDAARRLADYARRRGYEQSADGRFEGLDRLRNYWRENPAGRVARGIDEELRKIFEFEAAIDSAERSAVQMVSFDEAARRVAALREELAELRATQDAAARTPFERQQMILIGARVGTDAELNAEIAALARRSELTEDEARRAEQLVAARKELSRLYAESQSERTALAARRAALDAELAGTEALVAVKEREFRLALKESALRAGANDAQAEQYASETAAMSAALAVKNAEREIAIAAAESAGDDDEVRRLRSESAIASRALSLVSQGVSAAQAMDLARRAVDAENRRGGAQNAGSAAAEFVGDGSVSSAQAAIGGGVSLAIGGETLAALQRRSVDIQERMLRALEARQSVAVNLSGNVVLA